MTKKEFNKKLENAMFEHDIQEDSYFDKKINQIQRDLDDLRSEDGRSNSSIIANFEYNLRKMFAAKEANKQDIENLKERILNGEDFS